ncbi:MAG: AbrB/MazE/SpoVT family DNA-binding domain-containing protein [Halobacteriota archaeon]
METRRLQLIGGSSFMVSLPKNWVKENDLKQGDDIVLNVDGSEINLSPKKFEREGIKRVYVKKIMKYDKEYLFRFILSLYLQGFDEVVIQDVAITAPVVINISEIAKNFIGVEVMQAGDDGVIVKCLTVPEVDSLTLLLRMGEIVSGIIDSIDNAIMFKDHGELETVQKLEKDSDRLYYLIKRYENKLEINSDDRTVARVLEEISDSLTTLSIDIKDLEVASDILILLREMKEVFQSAFQSYIESDLESAEDTMINLSNLQNRIATSRYPLRGTYSCIKSLGETAFNKAVVGSVDGVGNGNKNNVND